MKELTLQEYYEEIQAEGLLFKSLGEEMLHAHSFGTEKDPQLDRVRLLISTSDTDRMKDVLDPHGVVLDNFQLNPLFLFEHGTKGNPEDSILGRIRNITETDSGLIAEAQYQPLDNNPLPAKIFEMEKKGLIPGNSIGWRPLGNITMQNGKRHVGKWELLEVSKVLIPANGKASNLQLGR